MGYLRIHCGNCGGTWEVYGREDFTNARHRVCPHCQENIDGQDWQNAVVPAFGEMMDMNRTLKNTSTGFKTPLFAVDYIADNFIPSAVERTQQAVFAAETRIADLLETIEEKAGAANG